MTTDRTLRRIQRAAYFTSRTAGDVAAAQRGPKQLARRVARRQAVRILFRLLTR